MLVIKNLDVIAVLVKDYVPGLTNYSELVEELIFVHVISDVLDFILISSLDVLTINSRGYVFVRL